MNLGLTIRSLRNQKKMSQADLAEALAVSRQSVSKWETDCAVPDLDKLLAMSELFEVSLDALVKGDLSDAAEETPQPSSGTPPESKDSRAAPYRTVGAILLCFGALIALLFLFLAGSPGGLLLAIPFLLCGLICLNARKRAGLWCAWASYLCVDLYLRYGTGITWQIIFSTIGYRPEWNYACLAVGWGQFLVGVFLLFSTLRAFRTAGLSRHYHLPPIAGGWLLLGGLSLLQSRMIRYLYSLPFEQTKGIWYYLIRCCGDYLRLALLAALLVVSFAFLRQRPRRTARVK